MRRVFGLLVGLSVMATSACGVEPESRAPSSLEKAGTAGAPGDPGGPCDPGTGANATSDACVVGVLGDGACADIVDFKLQVSGDLCADGLYPSTFDVDVGGCPDGQALVAKYTCCPPPPPSEQPEKPAPGDDPGASSCTVEELASAGCASIASLEADAGDVCSASGATLVDRKFAGDCLDGNANQVWFTCCVAP